MQPLIVGLLLAALALVGACAEPPSVTGIVERIDDEYGQVVITQPGVEGVLPEGTTSLRAAGSARAGLAPGQVVEITLARGQGGPEMKSARFVRWADESDGWIEVAGKRIHAERAESIALFDTEGRSVSLETLAGKIVLVDFIYTSCPGPCPAQTHNMRRVQKRLPDDVRGGVQFLSVTIDPETDDAATLAEYAERHGADLGTWSFLTGPVDEVEDTYARYEIGVTDDSAGGMDHTLRSFVIDDRGYLVERYRSDLFDPAAVARRLEELVRNAATRAPG